MSKVLIWIVVVFVVLFGLRLLNAAKAKRHAKAPEQGSAGQPQVETMVRCARCGVYLPRADATPGPAGLTCGDPGCAQRR